MKQNIKPIGWCVAAALALATTGNTNLAAQTPQTLQPTWTYASGTAGWIPDTVSIGNGGTRVFSAFGTFGSSAKLFSESAAEIATDGQTQLSFHHRVDSSSSGERRAWLYYHSPDPYTAATAELRVYAADSSVAQFTYVFPFATQQQRFGGVHMSSNGDQICAWAYNAQTGSTAVVVFNGLSTTPAISVNVPTFTEPNAANVSGDGTRLYLGTGTKSFLLDLTTGQLKLAQYNSFSAGMGNAINPDGTMYARGTSTGGMKLIQVQGTTQSLLHSHDVTGEYLCSRIAYSGDGSLLAATFDGYVDRAVRLILLDVSQNPPVLVYDHEVQGSGSLGFVSTDLEVNQEGSRVFVGTWGDEFGTVPEVFVHTKDGAGTWNNTYSVDLPGSVRDLDIDPSGDGFVVASKTVHASVIGGGGRYDHYSLPSGTGMRLVGTPQAGGSVEVRVDCAPGKTGLLLANNSLASTPTDFLNVGKLYLTRTGMSFMARAADNGQGELVFTINLASAEPGDTIYVQGLLFGPRQLTPGALAIEVTN